MAITERGDNMKVDVKQSREALNLTQEQVAQKVGVLRQTISNIECGIAKPSVETAKRLGKVLHVNWTDFFE